MISSLQHKTQNSKLVKLVSALLNWFAANARDLPWRRTRDPYAIWVSEIMLQQTQVKTVIPYWERWMRELPTIQAVAKASPGKIHKLWEGLGYYTRARNLHKAAKQIMEKHNGKFPKNYDDVLALPGIGRYTAGAICSIAFNQPTPVLDGNVIRVLTRVFGIDENPWERETNQLLWQISEKLVCRAKGAKGKLVGRAVPSPPRRGRDTAPYHSFLNQSLMELGALVCTPRNPQCRLCPVQSLCIAFGRDRVEQLPNLGNRRTAAACRFVAFVVERNRRFLVRQRPPGVVNAHLWEFPNAEILNGDFNPNLTAKNIFGIEPSSIKPLCTIKHSITHYRITLEAFMARLKNSPAQNGNVWKTPAQMQQLAFTAAHKKLASVAFNRILSGR